jgi:hypothetical protein
MGKTFSTGLLTNGVFQDASNNIGIGAAPSGSYKLEVTGTAKVSSTLLVSGVTTIKGDGESFIQQANSVNSSIFHSFYNSASTRRAYLGYGSNSSSIFNVWNQENGDIVFGTNNTEKARITSGGKVLIPSGGGGTSYFSMNYTSANAASREWQIGSDQTAWGAFSIAQATTQGGSTFSDKLVISKDGAVSIPATSTSTETLTVSSAAGSWAIVANGSTTTGSSFGLVVPAGTNSSDSSMIVRNTSGTNYLRVRGDGNIFLSSVVYNSTSDGTPRTVFIGASSYLSGQSSIRASKNNIENVSNVDWLYQLNPVTFNYRKRDEEGNYTEETYKDLNYGLIAEDAQPIADFLINYDDREEGGKKMIGIEYSRLITPMLKAIQEQQATITSLQDRLTKGGL